MWTRYIWPIALATAIFYSSSRQPVNFTTTWNIHHTDKLAHFVIFGLLAVSCCRLDLLGKHRPFANAVLAVILTSFYGYLDELHQSTTPGRMVEFADWVANTAGALVGVGLYTLWPRGRRILEMEISFNFPKWLYRKSK